MPWCAKSAPTAILIGVLAAVSAMLGSPRQVGADEPKEAPDRPRTRSYGHEKVRRFEIGTGPRSYSLFEPADPKPESAPVVVFLHGWFAVNPAFYGAWIDHLARSGRCVIFPRYQNDIGTLPREFLPNALAAIRDGLDVLASGEQHVRPDLEKFALIGHSAGANLAAQVAATSADSHSGVPVPRAVIALMPGQVFPSREPRLEDIPASVLLLVGVGEEDVLVGDHRGRQIFAQAQAVPRSRKRFLLFRSDRHGLPPLIAEHTAPTAANRQHDNGDGVFRGLQLSLGDVNAMDRAGFWRMGDVVLRAAFADKTLDEAIPDANTFTHLGYWSDGRKVTPPLMSDDPATLPRVIPSNGIRILPWDELGRLGDLSRPDRPSRVR